MLTAAFLVLITAAAYLPALRGGYIWDDKAHVSGVQLLEDASGLRSIWTRVGSGRGGTQQYYPLTYTSFWLEYRLWGLDPAGYHLTNVLLHGLNAVLVWLILLRLRVPGALLAALVFALHPVHVESVAWITQRKNVLSALFYLLSLRCFLVFLGFEEREGRSSPPAGAVSAVPYAAGAALFVCALAGKSVTATLPAAVLLALWWKRGGIGWKNFLLFSPLLAAGAAAGLLTAYLEERHVGASGAEWALAPAERFILAGRALWFYAGKLAWPSPLMFIYPRWDINGAAWGQYLFPSGAIAVMSALWSLRGRLGRGPLASVLFFAGTLLPALGFFNVYPMRFSYVADHFQYLASLGLIVPAAAGAALLSGRLELRYGPAAARAAVPAAASLLLALGVLTWRQSRIYRSSDSVWRDTLAKNPACWLAHHGLAVSLERQGRSQEALAHYREALRMKPDEAEARYNLGVSLETLGRREEAAAEYREALRLNPGFASACNNLGVVLAALGRPGEALEYYRRALRVKPDHPRARYNLGLALSALGRTGEAVEQYREALRSKPDDPDVHYDLGVDLAALGRGDEAAAHYREALRLRPDHPGARRSLGMLLKARDAPGPLK